MNKSEVREFIRYFKGIGDEWTEEQVEEVYGDCSLDEALLDRKTILDMFFGQIADILNN